MSELDAPLSRDERRELRVSRIQDLVARRALLDLQVRQELAVLRGEDTWFAEQRFVADELALALAESPRTTARWMDEAQMFCDSPLVMAKVADRTWTTRHADAVLSELQHAALEVRARVLDLVLGYAADGDVRTPYELRQATRAAVLLHDLDAAERAGDRAHEQRTITFHDERDGSATALINGTKTQLAMLQAALEAAVGTAQPGDDRSFGQRKFDYLLDLVCGRTQATAPWQALIVVSLSTLEGADDAPAEIPGLGLVTAEEARDVLASAELRRVVVDDQGQLVSIDSGTSKPDLVATQPASVPALSDAVEPLAVDDPEPDATADDHQWLASLPAEQRATARATEREVGPLLDDLCEQVWVEAEAYLADRAHQLQPAARGLREAHAPRPPDPPATGPYRPGGDGGGGPVSPRTPPPPTAPPGDELPPPLADRQWLDDQEALDATTAALHGLTHAQHRSVNPGSVLRERHQPVPAPSLNAQLRREDRLRRRASDGRWTLPALRHVLDRLRTAPVGPEPEPSKGYSFRGRLAHWIKVRDLTCTFPGCTLLAQRCESDHVLAYPAGPTCVDNGATECVHHHQAKHASIPVTRLPDGTMRWQPPSSAPVRRPPRPLLRGW